MQRLDKAERVGLYRDVFQRSQAGKLILEDLYETYVEPRSQLWISQQNMYYAAYQAGQADLVKQIMFVLKYGIEREEGETPEETYDEDMNL